MPNNPIATTASKSAVERKPVEAFHIVEYIREEMTCRGWDIDDLAARMTMYDLAINKAGLEFLFADAAEGGTGSLRIGDDGAKRLGYAFGVDPQFLLNLEAAWVKR